MSKLSELLGKRQGLAVLVDPDKHDQKSLTYLCGLMQNFPPDVILVGGSILYSDIDETVAILKEHLTIPVYLFPGDATQISLKADGILFLSLISGRNPAYLIGNHVIAAPRLKDSEVEVVPTAYMLIENGQTTSVEYMSNTRPIPFGKTDLAVATALAGEMLGLRQIYLEAGSGAQEAVGIDMIKEIKKAVDIPVIVGGGIRTVEKAQLVFEAGADMIVIGTQLEEFPDQISEFVKLRDQLDR